MQIRILTAADIRSALSMDAAIDAVATAYAQLSAGKATMPLRSRFHTDKGVTLLMPAHLHESGDFAVKIVSVYGDNPSLGLPTVAATVLALDPQTGMPLALMEGDSLTALRTGAAGGVAARYLARADAGTVALFGAGVQARAQLQAAMAVRQIKRVLIVDPFETAAQRLADDISTWPEPPAVSIAGFSAGRRCPGGYRAGRHNDDHPAFRRQRPETGHPCDRCRLVHPPDAGNRRDHHRPGTGGGGPAGCGHGRGRGHHYRQGDDRCGDRRDCQWR
jgi:hypothetical protein